ncbi:MAG: PAS domain S-box protein [Acidimicrobiales bacterium]
MSDVGAGTRPMPEDSGDRPREAVQGYSALAARVAALERELAAARASETTYRLLANASSEMVGLLDPGGCFEAVAGPVDGILGYEVSSLIGHDPTTYVHADDAERVMATYRTAMETRTIQRCEVRACRRDGLYVRVQVSIGVVDRDREVSQASVVIRDISRQAEVEERFRLALEEAPIGIAVVDIEGHWLTVNRALAELTGRSESELLSMSFQDITHPDDIKRDFQLRADVIEGKMQHIDVDKRYVRPDGTVVWAHLTSSLVRDENNEPLFFVSHSEDITERREIQQQLTASALTDPLTGVANRRLLYDRLTQARLRRNRDGGEIAVVFVDLDGLKATNDRLGHGAGDFVLQTIATRLTVAVRAGDTVARYGGDEFVVVCRLVDSSQLQPLLERLQLICAEPLVIEGEVVTLGASVGGVTVDHSETLASVLSRADKAMYEQKAVRRVVAEEAGPSAEASVEPLAPESPVVSGDGERGNRRWR